MRYTYGFVFSPPPFQTVFLLKTDRFPFSLLLSPFPFPFPLRVIVFFFFFFSSSIDHVYHCGLEEEGIASSRSFRIVTTF